MTTLLPPHTARPAPPAPPAGGVRPRAAVGWTAAALAVAALLNSDDLVRRADRLPYGTGRDLALDVTVAVDDVADALWLDRPRAFADRLRGVEHAWSPEPVPSAGPTTGPTTAPPTTTTAPPVAAAPRVPTKADPLRVLLVGDSVAKALGDSFSRTADGTGLVRTTVEFRYSSGLVRPDYYDWPKELAEALAAERPPEVAIVLLGANDGQPMMTPTGGAAFGTDAWRAEYGRRVGAVMDLLVGHGVEVYWVGQPVMRDARYDERMDVVDAVYAAEAARRKGVTFVDSRPLLSGADGRYAAYLPDEHGRPELVRTSDGKHLTRAGGDRITEVVLRTIRDRHRF